MNTETDIEQGKFQTAKVTLVSSAHAVHDTYAGFLPALLPVLIQKFSLTNTAAGFLSLFTTLPSLLQPFIGQLADRTNLRLLIIFAPAITGIAMSLLSIAPSYGFLVFLLILAGLSSASLHSIGPVLGSTMAGKKLGRGMSFWMVGGELGRSLGPLVVVTAISFLTIEGLPWLMLAGIFTSIFLFIKLNKITTQPLIKNEHQLGKIDHGKIWRVIIPLAVLIISRSMVSASISTFLPTLLTGEGSNLWIAGASLSILQAAGVVGAFFSGSLSDRFGRRTLLIISYVATPILMFLFMQVKGWLNLPLLVLLGFFAFSVIPVIMAIVMENYPANRSFANGIYMAFNFIVNSLAVVLAGRLGDLVNLRFTFLLSAGLILIGIPFVFFLPRSQKSLAL